MGSRDQIMELARHLRQLQRIEGALYTQLAQGTQHGPLWLLSNIPAIPADPAALMAQLESPTPCPHTLRAALGARELIELSPSRLARWSHALRCLHLCRDLERTVARGYPQLKAWRGQDLDARLARWSAQLERLKLATSSAPTTRRWRAQHIIGPWERLDEPSHLQAITQDAQPSPELWTAWGTYMERLAILYGADTAANAWSWANVVIDAQRHALANALQKRDMLISLSQRLDQRLDPPPTALPTSLMALYTTAPSQPHFAHTVACAFKDYLQEEPRVAAHSVRALARALRAASCDTFEQAIALCLERCPSAQLELKQVRAHLLMALHSPGKLKAPHTPLVTHGEDTPQELITTLVATKQEPLWPDHIHLPLTENTSIYQCLLEAHPPKHLMAKIAKEQIVLIHQLRPLIGRWKAFERLLEFMRRHPPVDYQDREVIEKLARSLRHDDERMLYAASRYALRQARAHSEAWQRLELAMQVLPQHRALLARWSEPPETLALPTQLSEHLSLSRHSAQDWRRYLHHRALCGHEATPSKNLLSNLERAHKHTKELEWLERTLAQPAQAMDDARRAQLEQRLLKLKGLDLSDLADAMRRMDNQMERASEQLAMRSLELLLEQALLAKLKLPPEHVLTLKADYIEALFLLTLLEDQALAKLFIDAIVSALPRRELAPNARWAKLAQDKGLDLSAWEQGFDLKIEDAQGRRWRIHTEDRIWERVLMGSAFDTCLALSSFNAPSAIINALDLNKHIIYVRDEHGHPVARKLIGLNQDLELIGYRIYTKPDAPQGVNLAQHITTACDALAQRCGAQLIDRGEPQQLHPGGLYDDGAISWSATPLSSTLALKPAWPDDDWARQEQHVEQRQAPNGAGRLWLNIYQAQRRQDGLPALDDDQWTCIDEPDPISTLSLDMDTLQLQSHTRIAHERGQDALCHHIIHHIAKLEGCCFDLRLTLQARSTAQTLQILKLLLRHEIEHNYDGYEHDLAANLCPHLLWALAADPHWRLIIRELKRPKSHALWLACIEIMSQLHVPGASTALHKLLRRPHEARALLECAHARQLTPPPALSDEARLAALEAQEATHTLSCADYFHLSRIARAHHQPHPHRSRALGLLCTRQLELHALGRRRKGNLTPITLSDPRELSPHHQLAIFQEALYHPWLDGHALAVALPWLRAITDDETQREAIAHWQSWHRSGRKNSSDRDESAVILARMTHQEPELAHLLFHTISQEDHNHRLHWMAAAITAAHYIGTPQASQLWTQALIEGLRRCPLDELRALLKPENMAPWGVKLLQTLCAQRELWLGEHRLGRMLEHLRGFESSPRASWMAQQLELSSSDEPMDDGECSSSP